MFAGINWNLLNIFCQRSYFGMAEKGIFDRFDEKKTVKVSGVSQLLRDQIEKEFQKSKNTAKYKDDVTKLYVCPNGQDYVLVEFKEDIPTNGPKKIGKTLTIYGTQLTVKPWKRQEEESEAVGSQSVSQFWSGDELDDEQVNPSKNKQGSNKNAGGKDQGKTAVGIDACEQEEVKLSQGVDKMPFCETKVKLSDDFSKKMRKEKHLKEIIKSEKVNIEEGGYLSGTWNAIFVVGHKIISFFRNSDETENRASSNFSFTSSFPDNQSSVHSTTTHEPMDTSPTSSDQTAQGQRPNESFTVNTFFLRHIMAYHYEVIQKLEKVSKEICIEVKSKTERNLKLIMRDDVDQAKFLKKVNKFIDFYQAQNQKMYQEEFSMPPKDKNQAISEARSKFSVVIDSSQEKDKITIYGEKDKVQEALNFLKSKVADLADKRHENEGRSSKATTGPSSPNGTRETVSVETFSCALAQHVKVAVYQGDITKETVDVIVNPANEYLKHSAGAAEAIVKVGGKLIQDESDDIMRQRGNRGLTPGTVVPTKAGRLHCNLIIHAVGPRWSNYYQKNEAKNALYNAAYNCLAMANQYGATSISMPAISSGIFGVPVDICAEVLFTAAINYAKNAPKSNILRDIRFVNIDKPTCKVFVDEMKKKFGSSVKKESVEMFHLNSAGRNANQNQQSLFELSKQSPPSTTAGVKAWTSVTYEGSNTSGSNIGNKGNKRSELNPKAAEFSGSGNRISSAPPSYSSAVSGKVKNEKDKNPSSDPSGSGDEKCAICLCDFTNKKTLDKCGHSFCSACIDEAFKHQRKCPSCSQVYGPLIGNQPEGSMSVSKLRSSLPGYKSCGTIVITYTFNSGTQGQNHPNPGKRYQGTTRYGYLPDNSEGQKVLKLLRKAFDQKLTFTIGWSSTLNMNNVITWNDIHHKTRTTGGATNFGYPDPDYLRRVQDELAAKGITE